MDLLPLSDRVCCHSARSVRTVYYQGSDALPSSDNTLILISEISDNALISISEYSPPPLSGIAERQ